MKLVDENTPDPRVRAVFEDILATKKIDRVPNVWRALATNPEHDADSTSWAPTLPGKAQPPSDTDWRGLGSR